MIFLISSCPYVNYHYNNNKVQNICTFIIFFLGTIVGLMYNLFLLFIIHILHQNFLTKQTNRNETNPYKFTAFYFPQIKIQISLSLSQVGQFKRKNQTQTRVKRINPKKKKNLWETREKVRTKD